MLYIGETGDLRRRINNQRSTIKTKKSRTRPAVRKHSNLSGQKWEDMTVKVIVLNPHWTNIVL